MKIDINGFIISYSLFMMIYSYAMFSYPIATDLDLFISIFSTAMVIVVPVLVFVLYNKKEKKKKIEKVI